MTWSYQRHRTSDRRYLAVLDSIGGGGWQGGVSGSHVIFETTTAREIGRVPFRQGGGDADPVTFTLDYEDDTRARLVARTILSPYGGADEVLSTDVFDALPPDDLHAPPEKPCMFFELIDAPTAERLVNIVDAIRGRLSCDTREDITPRNRDPRTVRLVTGNRVAVELAGDSEADILRRVRLDRPAILTAPPVRILTEGTNVWSGGDWLQVEIEMDVDGEVEGPIAMFLDGVPCGSLEKPFRGESSVKLTIQPDEWRELVRLVPYPLHVRARRCP